MTSKTIGTLCGLMKIILIKMSKYIPGSPIWFFFYILAWFKLYFDCFKYNIIYNNSLFSRIWISVSFRCLTSGFSSIRLSVLGKMSFKTFQDGRHLGYWNETNWAILNLQSPLYFPSSISSIRLSVREMSFKEFQNGRHLTYRNEKNWEIMNFHITPITPIKF